MERTQAPLGECGWHAGTDATCSPWDSVFVESSESGVCLSSVCPQVGRVCTCVSLQMWIACGGSTSCKHEQGNTRLHHTRKLGHTHHIISYHLCCNAVQAPPGEVNRPPPQPASKVHTPPTLSPTLTSLSKFEFVAKSWTLNCCRKCVLTPWDP